MDLRKNLRPIRKVELSVPEPVSQDRAVEEVVFEASSVSPVEALPALEEVRVVPPPLEPIKRASGADLEASRGIPSLQPIRREKKRIDLQPVAQEQSLPQPALEISGAAEPTTPVGGSREEWPFGQESQEEIHPEPTPALEQISAQQNPGASSPPPLEIIQRTPIQNLPPLDTFRTMEVVHLLLGKSSFDEEVVLLHSYAERDVKPKSPRQLEDMIFRRVDKHYTSMLSKSFYDMVERQSQRTLHRASIYPQMEAKGVEIGYVLKDTGLPSDEDIVKYLAETAYTEDEVSREEIVEKLRTGEESVYSWALVKVKIGHDFGEFKLSELMPDL